jgi:hypothetical protein
MLPQGGIVINVAEVAFWISMLRYVSSSRDISRP